MSRGLGKLQRLVLAELKAKPRDHFGRFKAKSRQPREVGFFELTYLAEGLEIPDGFNHPPKPSMATYKAIQRAVASLRKRGLVNTRMERGWPRDPAYVAVSLVRNPEVSENRTNLSVESSVKSPSVQHLKHTQPISQSDRLSA